MENLQRINELKETMGSFYYEYMPFLAIGVGVLVIIYFTAFFNYGDRIYDLKFSGPLLLVSVHIVMGIHSSAMYDKMNNELIALEKEVVSSFEQTATLQVVDIVNSIPVYDSYCPHVELKEGQECTFVEFIAEDSLTQVFIPLEANTYVRNANLKVLELTYLDVSEEEREFLVEKLSLDSFKINKKHSIHTESWSLGVSLEFK